MMITLINKLILLICFVIFQLASYGQNGFINKEEAKNYTDTKGYKQGKWKEYLNQNLKKTTIDSSVCYLLTNYKDDKPLGIQRAYYKEGRLLRETPFVNGKANGLVKTYTKTGQVQSEMTMVEDSARGEGFSKGYYPSGALIFEVGLLDGRIHGIMKQYYETGELQSEVPMFNDKMNGVKKSYFKNGSISTEQSWVNNTIFGITKNYNENNILIGEMFYDNEKIIVMKTFYPSGQLQSETPFLDGKINGITNLFMEDGTLCNQQKYVNGIADEAYNKKVNRKLLRKLAFKNIIADLKNPKTWVGLGSMIVQGLQQNVAYNDMVKNPTTKGVSNYIQILKNNSTLSSEDAMQANNKILESADTYNGNNSSSENTMITDAYNKNNAKLNALQKSNEAKRNANNVSQNKPIEINATPYTPVKDNTVYQTNITKRNTSSGSNTSNASTTVNKNNGYISNNSSGDSNNKTNNNTAAEENAQTSKCQMCLPNDNCVTVKLWHGTTTGACENYAKVINNTNTVITYKLCVLKANGRWDCGTDQVQPFSESTTSYYCDIASGFKTKIWAAYGDWIHQECKFPDPNK